MKTALKTTAIVSVILIQSCGSSKVTSSSSGKLKGIYYSRYLTPVIDGKINEWGDTLLYDNSTKSIYSIANDESALYITIKATERVQQMKIVQGGVEIWIDEKAKKNRSTGIRFPVGGVDMPMPTGRNSREDPKEMRQLAKLKLLTMELTGFKDGLNGPQSIYSNAQLKLALDWDNKDNLIYEVAIPFTSLEETVRANLNNISIGIFIKGLKIEQGSGGGMPGGGPPGGMPGGGPPGGMRPGGGTGRSMPDQSQIESITKENSFWTKYSISKN